jgi:hypothetical protein
LLLLGLAFLILSSLTRFGVTALRPVKDASGAQLYRPDGKMLMELDAWRNIKVNWQSNLFLLLGAILFLWCLIRLVRSCLGGHRAS